MRFWKFIHQGADFARKPCFADTAPTIFQYYKPQYLGIYRRDQTKAPRKTAKAKRQEKWLPHENLGESDGQATKDLPELQRMSITCLRYMEICIPSIFPGFPLV
jgi:hypothetical protein